jgi:hypothetical protein
VNVIGQSPASETRLRVWEEAAKDSTENFMDINPFLPSGEQVTHKLSRQQSIPISVGCNIHPWVKAYIIVSQRFLRYRFAGRRQS